MNIFDAVRRQLPDYPVVMRVRAVGDTGLGDTGNALLQSNGRELDVLAKVNGLTLTTGDEVLVLQMGRGQLPVVLGQSPWALNDNADTASTNGGTPWTAADITDFDAAVSANPMVAANTAWMHDRLHSFMDTADHDYDGEIPSNLQILHYDGSNWGPRTLTMTADGGSY